MKIVAYIIYLSIYLFIQVNCVNVFLSPSLVLGSLNVPSRQILDPIYYRPVDTRLYTQ
jgi:hypothetical protein